VELAADQWRSVVEERARTDVYLTGPTPPGEADGRVFLALDGSVSHACPLRATKPHPTGFVLELDVDELEPLRRPVTMRAREEWWRQAWQWRWWESPAR
jgi:hypothetical protein